MNTTGFDEMLRERFSGVAYSAGHPDWDDVQDRVSAASGLGRAATRRRPRRHRRLGLIAAATLLAILAAAPALGLTDRVTNLFTDGELAPAQTELQFATLDAGAPAGLETHVLAGTARKALETPLPEGASAVLWVAPSADGGFCEMVELFADRGVPRGGGGPGCDSRANLTGTGLIAPGPISSTGVMHGPLVLHGHATVPEAVAVVIRYQDGDTTTVPLTWISEPIDAGFFVFGVPRANWTIGQLPIELRFINSDGDAVVSPKQIAVVNLLRRVASPG